MKREIPNRRPCINTCTDNFHFSVSFDPHTGHPAEFFITDRGKVGQQLDTELSELSVKASCKESSKMICPECQKGMVQVKSSEMGGWFKAIPCPRCQGSGIAYCCDGEDYNAECYSNGDNVGSTSIRQSRSMV